MKKIKFGFLLTAALVLAVFSSQAVTYFTLMNGNYSTNFNAVLNASPSATNSVGTITNNFQLGQVPGASNVWFQLSSVQGSQPYLGTNQYLPASVANIEGSYPGTLAGPINKITIGAYASLMVSNATSTATVIRFAGSIDGVYWQTNVAALTLTIPVNSTTPTNFITATLESYGWAYFGLQDIENPGVAAMTNIVVEINGKSGL